MKSAFLEQIQQGVYREWSDVEDALRDAPLKADREAHQGDQGTRDRDDDERLLPALDALCLSPNLVILGGPGGGKNTFARFVIARLIEGAPLPGVSSDLLPVLVVLRDVAQRLGGIDLDALPPNSHADALADAVRDQILDDLKRLEAERFAEDLREALNAHRCLLVFDGLDEVPQELPGLVRCAVVATIHRYQPPRTIVTCRTRSYQEAMLEGFHAFTLASFDQNEIATCARAWYRAQHQLGRMDVMEADEKGTDLAEAALAPALRDLAQNPLLLTTMAVIHQQDKQLPEQRVCLYDRAVMLLLHRWELDRISNQALTALLRDESRLRRIMESLAYEAHQTRPRGQRGEAADLPRHTASDLIEEELGDPSKARSFLEYVDQRAGLLIGRPSASGRPDTYTFPRRTFQEYLAGCYLLAGRESKQVERFRTHAAEGDRWSLVAQLGAEELLFNTPARNAEQELFYLAQNLLEDELPGQQNQHAALWPGLMALLAGRERIERGAGSPDRGQASLRRLLPRMTTLLDSELTAPERCQAGDVLGSFDPRFRAEAWYLPG
jgi:predicted NACHT family NTPase